jgi:hypothetical protein
VWGKGPFPYSPGWSGVAARRPWKKFSKTGIDLGNPKKGLTLQNVVSEQAYLLKVVPGTIHDAEARGPISASSATLLAVPF